MRAIWATNMADVTLRTCKIVKCSRVARATVFLAGLAALTSGLAAQHDYSRAALRALAVSDATADLGVNRLPSVSTEPSRRRYLESRRWAAGRTAQTARVGQGSAMTVISGA